MLQLSCLYGLDSLDVIAANCNADDDGSCGAGAGGPCLLHGELCCPTDSLDDDTVVIEIIQDEQLLKDLATAASLPPTTTITTRHHRNDENSSSLWTTAWTTTPSSLPAEPPPPSPASAVSWLVVVPSRKRDRSVVMSGMRSWPSSLDMATIPTTRRRSSNNRRRGNGVRQPQGGLVPRRRGPRSMKRHEKACSRCDRTETPHWRAGPDGPGSLCNACGIRYTREQCKLLLLLPEYRSAAASQSKKAWSG